MNNRKIVKIISVALLFVGAVLLIKEIAAATKNYYLQSAGVVCLMFGLFLINSKLTSRSEENIDIHVEEEE